MSKLLPWQLDGSECAGQTPSVPCVPNSISNSEDSVAMIPTLVLTHADIHCKVERGPWGLALKCTFRCGQLVGKP